MSSRVPTNRFLGYLVVLSMSPLQSNSGISFDTVVTTHTTILPRFFCYFICKSDLQVEWYFNNRSVRYSSRIVKHNAGSDHSLVIRNVRTTDYGFYLCRASNSLGITEATVELSGIANPAVFKKASHSLSKTSYNFVWEVHSYNPIVQYEFRFRKYLVRS